MGYKIFMTGVLFASLINLPSICRLFDWDPPTSFKAITLSMVALGFALIPAGILIGIWF